MHPTAQHARSIQRQQFSFDQERNHTRAKQLLQRRVIAGKVRVCLITLLSCAHHMKPALAVKQSVRHQRVQVRMIFRQILQELQKKPEFANLTMADLQAALWYAEKRLYETAGEDTVEDSSVDKESTGYADNEAPDYSNASADVARGFGISEERIAEAIQKARDDGRAAAARSGDEQVLVEPKLGGKQGAAGGFTPSEKRAFRRSIATRTARTKTGSGGSVAGHEKNQYSRSNSDSGRIRLLKSLKAKYTEVWKAGADISRVYRAAGISTPEFYELQQTVD